MENEFKVPTFEPKLKVVTTTKKGKLPTDDANVSKEANEPPAVTLAKEPETAKCETAKYETELDKKLPKCSYIEPTWSKAPESSLVYSFEVLKGGQIVENVNNLQTKAFWTIGKFQTNDIVMAHPTISRYHAVLQYRPDVHANNGNSDDDDDDGDNQTESAPKPNIDKGWYLYDLNSTHGTFVNKMKVPPKTYVRIRVGYMLKFGASTRNYILQGPQFDEEAESEFTITEMKEQRLKKKLEQEQKQQEMEAKLLEEERKREEQGINWGMADDADEETDLSHNPFASTNNEELFLNDPKKTLRGFFEREGLNLDYKIDEVSNGTYVCRVELPITDSVGRSIVAEFTHKGKKKECVAQCALEACRILDRNGLLRQANHEPRKRKIESSDDDNDDEFYDRTAEAAEKRKRKAATEESVTLSYEQLLNEEKKLQSQLIETEKRIERYQQLEKEAKEKQSIDVDDLDDFMSGLSSEKQMDKADVRKCRFELQRIKADIQKVQKLINIAKPFELPSLNANTSTATHASSSSAQSKKSLPLFGKKKTFGFDKLKLQVTNKNVASASDDKAKQSESVEEFDEDDNDDSETKMANESKKIAVENEVIKEPITVDTAMTKTTTGCDNPTDEMAPPAQAETIEMTNKSPAIDVSHDQSNSMGQLPIDNVDDDDNNQLATPQIGSSSGANNKIKTKNRQRKKARQRIDIDEADEDTSPQKYSGWMPPENQTGDGMTSLNSKYGY